MRYFVGKAIAVVFVFGLLVSFSQAAYFEFEATQEHKGVVDLNVYLVPEDEERVYTASLVADFVGGQVESFSYNKDFLPLYNPAFDLVDNQKGRLIKTAGVPGGAVEKTLFAKMRFVINPEADVFVFSLSPESRILDAGNDNVLSKFSMVEIDLQKAMISTTTSPLKSKTSLQQSYTKQLNQDRTQTLEDTQAKIVLEKQKASTSSSTQDQTQNQTQSYFEKQDYTQYLAYLFITIGALFFAAALAFYLKR